MESEGELKLLEDAEYCAVCERCREVRGASYSSDASTISLRKLVLGCFAAFVAGTFFSGALVHYFFAGRDRVAEYGGLIAPAGTVEQVWYENKTFTSPPSPESEAAWQSIMPVGRGFIHEPHIAPFVSGIAVFHQMHCLHAVRVAYFAAEEAASADNATAHTFGTRIAPSHIGHCFDYLRRSLMCAADTNLEVLSANRTTNGWGQKKMCRDWDALWKYAETHANSTDFGILTYPSRNSSENRIEP